MTASVANQFGQVVFDPTAGTCASRPYAFHPMYSTSSEHTRVPWASHSYNVSFSDEIGHFEYCNAVSSEGGRCTSGGSDEGGTGLDRDDVGCFSGAMSLRANVGGCLASDGDFDGASYQRVWPGSTDPRTDAEFHPQAVQFAGPFFNGARRYERNAFEADLPRIEAADILDPRFPPCNVTTGANCVNPPPGAAFYPIYTTRHRPDVRRYVGDRVRPAAATGVPVGGRPAHPVPQLPPGARPQSLLARRFSDRAGCLTSRRRPGRQTRRAIRRRPTGTASWYAGPACRRAR